MLRATSGRGRSHREEYDGCGVSLGHQMDPGRGLRHILDGMCCIAGFDHFHFKAVNFLVRSRELVVLVSKGTTR